MQTNLRGKAANWILYPFEIILSSQAEAGKAVHTPPSPSVTRDDGICGMATEGASGGASTISGGEDGARAVPVCTSDSRTGIAEKQGRLSCNTCEGSPCLLPGLRAGSMHWQSCDQGQRSLGPTGLSVPLPGRPFQSGLIESSPT